MPGCARACLIPFVGWGAAGVAFYFYFLQLAYFEPQIYFASAAAGLLVVMAIGYALGIGKADRERRALLGAVSGTPLEDGAWAVVSGPIHSLNPLRGPMSGEPVVAYHYKITRIDRSDSDTSEFPVYEGKGLTPSTISTRHGAIRLLAVPFFEIPPETLDFDRALANATEYVNRTHFETRDTPREQRNSVEKESTDDDGHFRYDKQQSGADDRPFDESCSFEERHIKQGETVCAFGLYSKMRGGLVPHANWAKQTRIMRGDAAAVSVLLRKRMRNYAIVVVCTSALVWGLVALYQHFARLEG